MLEFDVRTDQGKTVAELIQLLRPFTTLAIGDIRRCISESRPLIKIEPFVGNWENNRLLLADLAHGIIKDTIPLKPYENINGCRESLSAELLKNLLIQLRNIELETDYTIQREQGQLPHPDRFGNDQPNWTGFDR